jgi:hypothetical protein
MDFSLAMNLTLIPDGTQVKYTFEWPQTAQDYVKLLTFKSHDVTAFATDSLAEMYFELSFDHEKITWGKQDSNPLKIINKKWRRAKSVVCEFRKYDNTRWNFYDKFGALLLQCSYYPT